MYRKTLTQVLYWLFAWILLVGITAGITSCTASSPEPTEPFPEFGDIDITSTKSTRFSYTYHKPDGNRFVSGHGTLPEITPIDIKLSANPGWVLGAPVGGGTLWVAILKDGETESFVITDGQVKRVEVEPDQLLSDMPPLLKLGSGHVTLVTAQPESASSITHPVVLSSGQLVYIEGSGDLVIVEGAETSRLALNCLPDARILVDEKDRLLLLTDATNRYTHGVLGDAIEAASISLIDTQTIPEVGLTIPLPADSVVEGLAPIWVDLNGDSQREIIATVSNAREGAKIIVFDESGKQLAAGPAIGSGYRWRHQIAVAPLGPNGEIELVDVRTPHIGGVVEFYRLEGNTLLIVAQISGYTSHTIHSRNLDMAVVGDFDGDGHFELLLPNQERTHLAGIKHTSIGAEEVYSISIGGRISTNIATVESNDNLALAVGTENNMLRVWQP